MLIWVVFFWPITYKQFEDFKFWIFLVTIIVLLKSNLVKNLWKPTGTALLRGGCGTNLGWCLFKFNIIIHILIPLFYAYLVVSEENEIVQPFLLGCDTKSLRVVQISLTALQRLITNEALSEVCINFVLPCGWVCFQLKQVFSLDWIRHFFVSYNYMIIL